MKNLLLRKFILALAISTLAISAGFGQGTTFNYQGVLRVTNAPANGAYDVTFTLYNLSSGGSAVSPTLTNTLSVTNGLFSTTLDFGAGPFNGNTNWIQLTVRTNGNGTFGILSPRQEVLPVPYAIFAESTPTAAALSAAAVSANLAGAYSGAVTLNNAGNAFTGNGAGLTGVDAFRLRGLPASQFWQAGGNAGTIAGPNWLGTADGQPFQLKANGQIGLRLVQAGSGLANIMGGSAGNFVVPGALSATISGGGQPGATNIVGATGGTVSGGFNNAVLNFSTTISGGANNRVGGNAAAITGGSENAANADHTLVGGGQANSVAAGGNYTAIGGGVNNTGTSSANYSTISGGDLNQVTANYATIAGGYANTVSGAFSMAAGNRAKALSIGDFVWGDSLATDFSSTTSDEFSVRSDNGVRIQADKGIHLTAGDLPMVVRDWDVFAPTAPAGKAGIGRWGLFMEPSRLALGIPGDDVPGRFFQVAKYSSAGSRSGLLTVDQAGTTTSARFSGNGAVGWQVPAGTTVQANPNTGYLLNNAAQVTLTLPASPNVTDVVRVNGIGSGGWKIAQNSGQSVMGSFFATQGLSTNWLQTSSSLFLNCVASSSDGSRLIGAQNGGTVYTSQNSGTSWTSNNFAFAFWTSVASSSNGLKIVATKGGGGVQSFIYTSTDGGANWTQRATAQFWGAVASSADGVKLVAVSGSLIYTSADSGVTWTPTSAPSATWSAAASSADGTKLVAAAHNGRVYTSPDSGVTWNLSPDPPQQYWSAAACSADGSIVLLSVGGIFSGYLWVSHDGGATFNLGNNSTLQQWFAVACSADGNKQFAVVDGGAIWQSLNAGITWTKTGQNAGNQAWRGVACSQDGGKVVAVGNGGVWVGQPDGKSTTTTGASGFLTGSQATSVELQYVGNNQFMMLRHQGLIKAN